MWSKKLHQFLKGNIESISANDILLLYELEDADAFNKTGETRYGMEDEGDTCGVVLHFRQPKANSYSSYSSKECVGIPIMFCMRRRTNARELLSTVSAELQRRFGEPVRGWQLFKCDKYGIDNGGT